MREYGVVNSWTKKFVPLETKFGTGLISLDPASLNEQILGIKNSTWVTYTPNSWRA
jgi:hypothetical protein